MDIITEPNKLLRTKSINCDGRTPKIKYLAREMLETLHGIPECLGLAAIQVGVPLRLVVLNNRYMPEVPEILVNPIIMSYDENSIIDSTEGCLSIPGAEATVRRASEINVLYYNTKGNKIYETFKGVAAICIQHEVDHIDGVLMSDRIGKNFMLKLPNI